MEFINRCTLTVNGQEITDFKSVTEKEVEHHRPVNLMHKTGHCKVTSRFAASVDYVEPAGQPGFDWESVVDGTLTIEYEGGSRVNYGGVYVLKVGEAKIDGDNELVRTIELGAQTRTKG
jgi:hypothetical protein